VIQKALDVAFGPRRNRPATSVRRLAIFTVLAPASDNRQRLLHVFTEELRRSASLLRRSIVTPLGLLLRKLEVSRQFVHSYTKRDRRFFPVELSKIDAHHTAVTTASVPDFEPVS
jgi:hypothetical protein